MVCRRQTHGKLIRQIRTAKSPDTPTANNSTHGKAFAVIRFQSNGKLHGLFAVHSSLNYGNDPFLETKKKPKKSVIRLAGCKQRRPPVSPDASSTAHPPRRTPAELPTRLAARQ
jgi:hypothetical protein